MLSGRHLSGLKCLIFIVQLCCFFSAEAFLYVSQQIVTVRCDETTVGLAVRGPEPVLKLWHGGGFFGFIVKLIEYSNLLQFLE